MANKYWETETPVIMSTSTNEIRVYPENGKIQVYPKVDNAPRGIGRGATIDLAGMTRKQVDELEKQVVAAINKRRADIRKEGLE